MGPDVITAEEMRLMASALCFLALLQLSCGFIVQQPALRSPVAHATGRHLVALRMQEEPAAETPPPVVTPPVVTPPPAPKDEGFDFTQYSLTIGIATLFVIVKTLSYFGIIDTTGR